MPVRSADGAWPSLTALIRVAAAVAADLVVPKRCGLCGAFGAFLCPDCHAALPVASGNFCSGCARVLTGIRSPPHGDLSLCWRCHALPEQPLDSLCAVYRFEGDARRLVHRLKYERLSALAGPMGAAMATFAAAALPSPDLIVPVPLHPRRERDRGFNQAALLAREIGSWLGVPVDRRVLVRTRPTAQQARLGGPEARTANVAGAFACRGAVMGRRVLLIDDVATTGATLRACAAPVRAAGAAQVHALVFAHGD